MTCFKMLAIIGVLCCGLIVAASVHSTAANEPGKINGDAEAIRQAGSAYVEALRRGDAEAVAAHWAPGGIYVDATGRSFDAHALIRQQFEFGQAQDAASGVEVDPKSSIRFVTTNVAIEEGTSRATNGADATGGRFTAVWVKKGENWLLDSLREWEPTAGAHDSPLKALSWMVGDWRGQGDDIIVRWSGAWNENAKFIVRRLTVERDGDVVLSGMQRVGWDAAAGKIRSWTFLSDGSIVQGVWRREDSSWIQKTNGVLADGKRSSAVNFWIPEGEDRWVLKSSHVKAGDAALEDSVVEFQRTNERN